MNISSSVQTRVLDRRWLAAASLLACASALGFVWTLWCYAQGIFAESLNSDAAVPILLAREILRTGQFVPASWYYGNDDLWIFSPQLLALPFVAWLGATPVALLASNLVGIFLMVIAMSLLAHRLTLRLPQAITVALSLAALYSVMQRDVVYTQIAYGWITTKVLVLLYLALRIVGRFDVRARDMVRWDVVTYVGLLTFFAAESPSRAAIYWCVPVAAVCLIGNPFRCSRRLVRALLGLTAAAALCGVAMHMALRSSLIASPGLSFAIRPISAWPHSIGQIWNGLPLLLGIGGSAGTLPWAAAVLGAIRSAAVAVAAVYVIVAMSIATTKDAALASTARIAAAMLLGTCIVLCIGTLAGGPSSARYLIPPLFVALLAAIAAVLHALRRVEWAGVVVLLVFAAGFGGGAVLFAHASASPAPPSDSCVAPRSVCGLLSELQELPVKQGFATYWNAGVTTLASAGSVSVCPIMLGPRPLAYRWLTSTECFNPMRYANGYFIVVSDTEVHAINPAVYFADMAPPQRTLHEAGFTIWLFGAPSPGALDWLRN